MEMQLQRERIRLAELWIVTGLSKESGQVIQRWVVWAPAREDAIRAVKETDKLVETTEDLSAVNLTFEYVNEYDLTAVCEV